MNMTLLDWSIIFVLLAIMVFAALKIKKYNRSVADFLAANRCAGRYMLGVSDGIAGLGAISIIALFEAYFASGFTFVWWGLLLIAVKNITALSGWVQYRFRQTRALTMAEFLGMRYSRNLRVYAGILAFTSGIINFGIFPAVGARFFQYFCGFGSYTINIPFLPPIDLVYAMIMIVLLALALFFTFTGGQISVMITDFIQGTFANIVILIVVGFLLYQIPWEAVYETLSQAPQGNSMLDPYDTAETKIFNKWYYIIISFCTFWTFLAWQGNQAYSASATNAHEARMGRIFGSWREYTQTLPLVFLAVCAYVIYNNPRWSGLIPAINENLDFIENQAGTAVRNQTQVSVILGQFLTKGMVGAFCAVILAAFISTHDTYLHSWGSILIQDVILPFRKKKLSTKEHINLLRISIFSVAVFIFLFSLFFAQYDAILMFQALTGIIFLGGGGTIIVFGLYWKRGTTAGAYTALSIGVLTFIIGFTLQKIWLHFRDGQPFPINSSWLLFISILISVIGYVVVSLLTKDPCIDTDKLFNKGKYAVETQHQISKPTVSLNLWHKILRIDNDFTFKDKIIYCCITGWTFLWVGLFFAGTIVRAFYPITQDFWAAFWHFYVWMGFSVGCFTSVWFLFGGSLDMLKLIKRLKNVVQDESDDGE